MIIVKKVSKIFKKQINKKETEEFYADHDISFEANDGEIVGILGPNGAGKTTLLRMIAGIMEPSETIFYMLVAYYILICIVVIADIFIDNFMNESIIALYVIAMLCNYLGLVVVDKTMKEVTTLIETSGRGKKKIK